LYFRRSIIIHNLPLYVNSKHQKFFLF